MASSRLVGNHKYIRGLPPGLLCSVWSIKYPKVPLCKRQRHPPRACRCGQAPAGLPVLDEVIHRVLTSYPQGYTQGIQAPTWHWMALESGGTHGTCGCRYSHHTGPQHYMALHRPLHSPPNGESSRLEQCVKFTLDGERGMPHSAPHRRHGVATN